MVTISKVEEEKDLLRSNRTSYYGRCVWCSLKDIVSIFGKPHYTSPKSEKAQYEWILETSEGNIITLYDWKQHRNFHDDEVICWHIGSHGRQAARLGEELIKMEINVHNLLNND